MTMGTRVPDGTHAGVGRGREDPSGGPSRLLNDACKLDAPSSILRLDTSGLASVNTQIRPYMIT